VTEPGSGLPVCDENDPLVIRIHARVKKTILYPRIYVQIRDFRGYIIYGIHTMPDELQKVDTDEHFELSATLLLGQR